MLTEIERERYSRQLSIPWFGPGGQESMKGASVLVVGAGGLGSPLTFYLAAAGTGTIGIIDSDTISLSNLQRQILYTAADIGKPKADTAVKRLKALNPDLDIRGINLRFTRENSLALSEGYDIIVDCTDNFESRIIIDEVSRQKMIPMVFGAVYQFAGQVSVFNYHGGPSYCSLFPEEMISSIDTSGEAPGIIGAIPGIIGSVQAGEVIKIITGAGNVLSGQLFQFDALNMRVEIISI